MADCIVEPIPYPLLYQCSLPCTCVQPPAVGGDVLNPVQSCDFLPLMGCEHVSHGIEMGLCTRSGSSTSAVTRTGQASALVPGKVDAC